jgi:cell division initiation protein
VRITPLDIIQKQFAATRKGYEPDEVRAFLDQVRDALEEALKENQRLRELVARREQEIAELRDSESEIKETLLLARRLTEDLRREARREADVVVGEARLEAERILRASAEERRDTEGELVRLRAARARALSDLRGVVEAQSRLVQELERGEPG